MDTKNQILFEPTPKQEEFLAAVFSGKYKYLLFGGAIRGGKSVAVLTSLVLLSRKYPGSRWVVIRDTLQNLKLTTIPSFNEICPASFIQRFNQETQTCSFVNGSQILFFGENYADDKELLRFRGLECSGIVLEECNELQESTFYKCLERSGTFIPRKGEKPKPVILLTCNPSSGWVKSLFYTRWKDGTLPKDWYYLPALIRDNKYMMSDESYLEGLKNMPRHQYEVMVNGNWDIELQTGGEIYKCFNLDTHITQCKYDPALALHISFDENVSPFLPAVIAQISEKKDILIVDEITGKHPNNTVEAVCKEFTRRYRNHRAGVFTYGDATSLKRDTKLEQGANFFTLIRSYLDQFKPALRVLSSNPSVAMRCSFINSILEKETFGLKIRIDEGCKVTIEDFIKTKEDSDGTKVKNVVTDPKTKSRYQQQGHMTDAFEYFMVSAFANQYKQYQQGGRTPHPMIMGRRGPSRHNLSNY
jgi:Phage terminase large subunit